MPVAWAFGNLPKLFAFFPITIVSEWVLRTRFARITWLSKVVKNGSEDTFVELICSGPLMRELSRKTVMKKAGSSNGHSFKALELKIACFDNLFETTDGHLIEPTFNFIESGCVIALKVRAPTN